MGIEWYFVFSLGLFFIGALIGTSTAIFFGSKAYGKNIDRLEEVTARLEDMIIFESAEKVAGEILEDN